ncbi:hypothetical protein FOZ60_008322 [Perkinsus olseni]|uniref:SET domain-containing protein n=2 Tax=Perkinsus olseni TaxID=32597 RepID=A0A7J6NJH2_PEROL|nr:hypothetical protein FOZ60_008322 [Perkinsus olseni]
MPKKKARSKTPVRSHGAGDACDLPRGFEKLLPGVPGHTKSILRPRVKTLADCFEVRFNSACGMGLYAVEDIPEGCVLLEEEPAVIIQPHRDCAVAGTLDNLLWIMQHFSDARKLRQYLYPRMGDAVDGLPEGIRDDIDSFSHFFSHEQSSKWLARPAAWRSVMEVFDDEEEAPSEALCRDFIDTFREFRRNHSDREIREMATVSECIALNSFKNTISRGGVPCLGAATCVFLVASLLNHSCMPNVSISTYNPETIDASPQLTAVTVRPVMAGEQLCMCYFGHHLLFATSPFFDSVGERRDRMLKEKHFLCMCDRCQDEVKGLSDWESFQCPLCDGGACVKMDGVFKCRKCGSEDSVQLDDTRKWLVKATLTLRLMMQVVCNALAEARITGETDALIAVSEKLTKLAIQGGVLPETLGGPSFLERQVIPHEEHYIVHKALTMLVHAHRLNARRILGCGTMILQQSKALCTARKALKLGAIFDETFSNEGRPGEDVDQLETWVHDGQLFLVMSFFSGVRAAVGSSSPGLATSTTITPPTPQPAFTPPVVRNSFVLRYTSGEEAGRNYHQLSHGPPPELKSIVARLLSFGDVQKLDFQHWRELGVITACYFDTRNAEKAFDHYYMLGEEAWEVLWSESHDQENYFVSVPAEDLAVADPSQYGDMANISSPPGDAGTDLKLLIQFFDCRAARSMREAQRKMGVGPGVSDPGSASTVTSSLIGADFGITSLVDVAAPPVLLDRVPRMSSLSPPPPLPTRVASGPTPYTMLLEGAEGREDYSVNPEGCWKDPRTTIMIKNIPNKLTQQRMLQMIDDVSPQSYDFFYLPIDLRNRCNVGYAFINFIDPARIMSFYRAFHGAGWKNFNNSKKICDLSYARIQGKEALMQHFTSATLPKNPAMRPLFRLGQNLQPLRVPGEATRYASCGIGMEPSSSSIISLGGLLPEPTRARTSPAGRPYQ